MKKRINPPYTPGEIPDERWVDIPGYEGKYQISNYGRVLSLQYKKGSTGRILIARTPQRKTISGKTDMYPFVMLSKNNKVQVCKIHRAVAKAFVPNPDNKPYVNHKDGNKDNNHAENLEWVTPLENNLHAYRELKKHPMRGIKYSLNKTGKKVNQYWLNEYGEMCLVATYTNIQAAAIINNLSASSISGCCRQNKGYSQRGGYIWQYEENSIVNK